MGDARLLLGDCLEVMGTLPDGSVDAVVTDPPAGIAFMGKTWDKPGVLGVSGGRAMPVTTSSRNPSCRQCGGRMRAGEATKGCSCDSPDWNDKEYARRDRQAFIDFLRVRMAEAYRVAKPGTYALVWALPRTSHWTATAIEDAGWTIRDVVVHLQSQGFPKSKSCLKPGAEHWILGYKPGGKMAPLQIDACRVEGANGDGNWAGMQKNGGYSGIRKDGHTCEQKNALGRWPANAIFSHSASCRLVGTRQVKSNGHHPAARNGLSMWAGEGGGLVGNSGPERYMGDDDGLETVEAWECDEDCPVRMLDEQSGTLKSGRLTPAHTDRGKVSGVLGQFSGRTIDREFGGDSGGASRFFATFPPDPEVTEPEARFVYAAKASRADRGPDNHHPTVKGEALSRWLCRLITPPGGTILDPFMGSGSTGKAAILEGFGFVGIEQDEDYHRIAVGRIDEARGRAVDVTSGRPHAPASRPARRPAAPAGQPTFAWPDEADAAG